ncbi:MAG: Coproporphyrinogen oxidase [Bacteroidota bacterium]|nr:Coproporphyrinogen oxidase [Bacteroidota bacterium]
MIMNTELDNIIAYFKKLQNEICNSLEHLDGSAKFNSDEWNREEGGGGLTKVILDGNVFEKGGVNFSHVYGKLPEVLKKEIAKENDDAYFHATGISIVIHPKNPFVPIIHMNVRYFKMLDKEGGITIDEWFGGGIDLSPAYPNEADAKHFHSTLNTVCDHFDSEYYPKFKKWSDDYFTITHRREMRGVGGIFFDHLRPANDNEREKLFSFLQSVGNCFIPLYTELVKRNNDKTFTPKNKEWQFIRRGRYAEFNLVYDRGTHFGLRTNGRIESILMSLPPHAEWKYDHHPEKNSEEEKTLVFFQAKNWL